MPTPKTFDARFKRFWVVITLLSAFLIIALLALIYQSSARIDWRSSPLFSRIAVQQDMGMDASVSKEFVGMGESAPGFAPSPMPPDIRFAPNGAPEEDRERIGERIIRNGSLTLRVDSAEARMNELRGIVEAADGFIEHANIVDRSGVKTANATIRVPVERFEEMLEQVKALASTVFSESTSGEDVTAQFVDVDARLRAARAEEEQYLRILEDADTVEETLQVTARLAEVRSRIEQMEAQLRYLRDRTEYATIQVTMTEEARVEVPTRVWKPGETFRLALRELVVALQNTADVLIAAAVFFVGLILPIVLVLALIAWGVRALWNALRRKRS